jgi:methionyl-tRNA formyltransferase
VLDQASAGQLHPERQNNELACYANKIDKAEANIDWHLPAPELQRKVRAFNPFPVAYSQLGEQRIKIYAATVVEKNFQQAAGTIVNHDDQGIQVACGKQGLKILTLQLPGKKAMSSAEALRGYASSFSVGKRFN